MIIKSLLAMVINKRNIGSNDCKSLLRMIQSVASNGYISLLPMFLLLIIIASNDLQIVVNNSIYHC